MDIETGVADPDVGDDHVFGMTRRTGLPVLDESVCNVLRQLSVLCASVCCRSTTGKSVRHCGLVCLLGGVSIGWEWQ